MRGELIGVWPSAWREIWAKLGKHPAATTDIYCELYRELTGALVAPPDSQALAEIIDDPSTARTSLMKTKPRDLLGEKELAFFFEEAHPILYELGGDALANYYFNLLSTFVDRYSLRYDLRRPCSLCPTLPGVFSSLFRDLRDVTSGDAHLDGLMTDFENSIRDLRGGASGARIKSCIQKQVNLLEALGQVSPGVTQNTLGRICDEVGTWPHAKMSQAMKSLYGFACDYPGIRHGGTAANAIRPIEMRDLIATAILLAGFTPYLAHQLDPDAIYQR